MAFPTRRITPQRVPTRPRSRRVVASPYNSGGRFPTIVRAIQKRVPTRPTGNSNSGIGPINASRSRWIQPPIYNSGGLKPSLALVKAQKPATGRKNSRWFVAPLYNSGSFSPRMVQGARRGPPLSRKQASDLYIPLQYNSGGYRPLRTQGIGRKNLTRSRSQLRIAASVFVPSAYPSPIISGVSRKNFSRSRSRIQAAPIYNSGSLRPTLISGRRWPLPQRADSRTLPASPYNSGGSRPLRTQGVGRKNLSRALSRIYVRTPGVTLPGVNPRPPISQGIRRKNLIDLRRPQFIQPGSQPTIPTGRISTHYAVAASITTTSFADVKTRFIPGGSGQFGGVISALQKRRISGFKSSRIVVAQAYNSGGLRPTVLKGRKWAAQLRTPTRVIIAPPSTPAGSRSQLTQGVRRKNLTRSSTRLRIAPVYNSGGNFPQRFQGIRRNNLSRALSRIRLALPYNSGSILPPIKLQGRAWSLPLRSKSRSLPAPLYNSGGLSPRRTQGIRRKNLTRSQSHIQVAPAYNSGSFKPTQIIGRKWAAQLRSLSRRIIPTPSVVVQPTTPAPVIRGIRRKNLIDLRHSTFITSASTPVQTAKSASFVSGIQKPAISGFKNSSRLVIAAPSVIVVAGQKPTLTTGAKQRAGRIRPRSRWLPGRPRTPFNYNFTVNESLSATDSTQNGNRKLTAETLTFSDFTSETGTYSRSTSDSFTVADTATRFTGTAYVVNVSDTVTFSDSTRKAVAKQASEFNQTRDYQDYQKKAKGTYASSVASDDPLAWWRLDDNPNASQPLDHVVVVLFENNWRDNVMAQGSWLNALASNNAQATNYTGLFHPSIGDYFALIFGTNFGNNDDNTTTTYPNLNLAQLCDQAGVTWGVYAEDMNASNMTANVNQYVRRHNPFAYSQYVLGGGTSNSHVKNYGSFNPASMERFVWITPNLCNDMHDCSIATGDTWARNNLQPILNHPEFANKNSLLIVVFDEDDSAHGNQVYCAFAGPAAKASINSTVAYNHYNLLATMERALGLGNCGQNDATAAVMGDLVTLPPPPSTLAADQQGRYSGKYIGGVTRLVTGALIGDADTAASFDGSTGYVDTHLYPHPSSISRLPHLSVLNADTAAKKQAWVNAHGSDVVITANWSDLQPGSGALSAAAVTSLLQAISDAEANNLEVTLELALHATPAWVQTAVPDFLDQSGTSASSQFSTTVRDWIWTQTGRNLVSDFVQRTLAAITDINLRVHRIRVGGGSGGALHFPNPGGSAPFHLWGFGNAPQTGTGLATGQVICPFPGYTPWYDPNRTDTKDNDWLAWYWNSLGNWIMYYINQLRIGGYQNVIEVIHSGAGVRSNQTWQSAAFQAAAAAGEHPHFLFNIYKNVNGINPSHTWLDSQDSIYPPVLDTDKAPWRKVSDEAVLFNLADAYDFWGTNLGGNDVSAITNIFNTSTGPLQSGKFTGVIWNDYASINSGSGGNAFTWGSTAYGNNSLPYGGSSSALSTLTAAIDNSRTLRGGSIEVWVNLPNNPTAHRGIAGWRNDAATPNTANFYLLQLLGTNTLECRFTNSAGTVAQVSPNPTITPNVWHHLVLVYDGGNLTLYVDGASAGSGAASGLLAKGGNFRIGTSNGNWMQGPLDEVAYYDYALSPSRILAHYQAGAGLIGSTQTSTQHTLVETSSTQDSVIATWFSGISNWVASASDSFSLSDSISKLLRASRQAQETVINTDSTRKNTEKVVQEILSLFEFAVRGSVRSVSESLSVADSIRKGVGKKTSETLSTVDTIIRGQGIRLVTETLSFAESVIARLGRSRSTSESLSHSDTASRQGNLSIRPVENIPTGDTLFDLAGHFYSGIVETFIAVVRHFAHRAHERFASPVLHATHQAQGRTFKFRGIPTDEMSLIDVMPPTFEITTTEQIPLNFDTTLLLQPGETVSAPTVNLYDESNNVANTLAITGAPAVSGNIIQVTINGARLSPGKTYRLVVGFTPISGKIVNMKLQLIVAF